MPQRAAQQRGVEFATGVDQRVLLAERGGARLLEQPVLCRQQLDRPGDRPQLGGARPAADRRIGNRRQPGDCRVIEKLLRGQPKAAFFRPGDDLDGEDRVAAEVKKVIVDAEFVRLDAEDLGPHLGQPGFGRAARRPAAGGLFDGE